MWSRSLEEGFGCLGKFSDFILWSLERPLKGQIGAVIRIPSGDDRSGSCVEPAGKTRAAGPVRKLIAMMQALGVGVTEAQEAVEREADGPTPFTGLCLPLNHPQKSTFPKQLSRHSECQPLASFCF